MDPFTLFLVGLGVLILFEKKGSSPRGRALEAAGMSVFPVTVDVAAFSNDYRHDAPEDPAGPRKHLGIDIFAPKGTAVFAPERGKVTFATDPVGGQVFYLTGKSGTKYYGAHLMGYVGQSRQVKAGEQIGFVGDSGNAAGGPAHLHFQMNGGETNPYTVLRALAPNAPLAPWDKQRSVA